MKRALFDVETDGLLHAVEEDGKNIPEMTQIHCLVLRDHETDEVLSCTNASPDFPSLEKGLEVLEKAERIYAHNLWGFDLHAIRRMYPRWKPKGELLDTLPIMRARFAHIKETDYSRARRTSFPSGMIGLHNLEAWGHRLGVWKGDFAKTTDWSEWSYEMQVYCEEDTSVLRAIVDKIRRAGALPRDVIEMEQELARYLTQQERNGWPFDFEKAVRLQAELAQRREELTDELVENFGIWYEPKTKHGEIVEFIPKRNNSRYGYVEGAPCTKLVQKEFNPASRHHIANRLQTLYGWEPTEHTPTGEPKVSEESLKGLDIPFTDDLVEYLMVNKRLGQIAEGKQAWLKHMEDDRPEGGRLTGLIHIHHSCTATTITHRHRHSHPNVGQVPGAHVKYGPECRELWTIPPGWKILGVDVDGLELRCLAHYMWRWDDGEYAEAILEGSKADGTDVHSRNAKALSLARDKAKTWIYAYLYGSGDENLGSIIEPHAGPTRQAKIGAEARAQFENQTPALKKLVSMVKKFHKKRGYLHLIDGRRAYTRSGHAALNTLLQGTGGVTCKRWITFAAAALEAELGPQGWEELWAALAWVHDETQTAVRGEAVEKAPPIWTQAIQDAGEALGFRLPLTGSFDLGDNWKETH